MGNGSEPSQPLRDNGESSAPNSSGKATPSAFDGLGNFCALCARRDPRVTEGTTGQNDQLNWLCRVHATWALNRIDALTRYNIQANASLAFARGLYPDGPQPPDPETIPADPIPDSSRNGGPAISELGVPSEVDALPTPADTVYRQFMEADAQGQTEDAAEENPGPQRGRCQRTVARLRGMLGLTTRNQSP